MVEIWPTLKYLGILGARLSWFTNKQEGNKFFSVPILGVVSTTPQYR